MRARYPSPDAVPTAKIPRPPAPEAAATARIPRPVSPADASSTDEIPRTPADAPPPARTGNRQTILLIAVIAVALVIGGLAAAELYARHRADTILVGVAQCVVEDGATISYGVNPPFLWQHITGDYTNISVETAGNRVQAAEGMTADVTMTDIRLQGTADSAGTIGAVNATLSWTSAGIKDTVAANLPGVGNLVTDVRTDVAAGTLIMEAAGGTSVTAEPAVVDGDLTLRVLDATGPLSKETVQTAFDELTATLNDNYPLGIRADSVEVTDAGVVGKFSSQDASIPTGETNSCFAGL